MKNIKTYFPGIILILLITATGILKAQPEDKSCDTFLQHIALQQQDEEVAPLPFNTAQIASAVFFQRIEKEDLSAEEEISVPLPPEVKKMSSQIQLEEAWERASVVPDESEIDDLPPAVKQFMANFQKCLLAETRKK
ncbi:hypothetical protein LA303_02345 [Candidatus Sulfidibacterium hydrothermale]|uniref:hypothetical protein n=1 Tax=Candidatus Sulfidibacterium hydrothermale TaxID=2875962 RepID=UPI001F0B6017|nr:hypothetical protein [Candidatus Sulfidibacterium hydrothermale]UBM62830.1 hypothetical protein LA303_02345 [Candidatus Sulfidibacterium hydrothermale]